MRKIHHKTTKECNRGSWEDFLWPYTMINSENFPPFSLCFDKVPIENITFKNTFRKSLGPHNFSQLWAQPADVLCAWLLENASGTSGGHRWNKWDQWCAFMFNVST